MPQALRITFFLLLSAVTTFSWSYNLCGVNYQNTELLGQGSFGAVYKAVDVATGRLVAVKFVKTTTRKEHITFFREFQAMQRFEGDEGFVQFICEEAFQSYSVIVMEYCNQGDLSSVAGTLSEEKILNIWEDLSAALLKMRQKQIVHRDLKLENIFLHDGRIKIGDFGLSKHLAAGEMPSSTTGTPLYYSPEMLRGKRYDYQVDLWAAGIILYEVSQGEHPFIHHNGRVTAQELDLGINEFLAKKDRFKSISPAITKILNALLQENPTMRYIDVQGTFVRR